MGLGFDLISLQQTDLDLVRVKQELQSMPIIAELAKKRTSYTKLKAEATRILAQRKDAQTALDDIDAGTQRCHREIAEAKAQPIDPSDYRQVQDLEEKLGLLAKHLDKLAFDRPNKVQALEEIQEKETKLLAYIKRFEESIVADTKAARAQAAELQASIDELQRRREHLLGKLPEDVRATYERGLKRFKGLCVERIEGNVPTVCRTALQPASMDMLKHADQIAECPYCHRIIVVSEGE
ncbi:MAG: C4-type zinc ribbon domain-containing protein [Coriobacteriaceae bacterium]|nr:C4-type zinc ribbon domain-containing protein [Coriobacteriaceae bacterium]